MEMKQAFERCLKAAMALQPYVGSDSTVVSLECDTKKGHYWSTAQNKTYYESVGWSDCPVESLNKLTNVLINKRQELESNDKTFTTQKLPDTYRTGLEI